MHSDDATATYRGYRRQALYALERLFDDALPQGTIIQPEGSEDVAIYDSGGSLTEIVQVKDHTANLAASSFKSSFYARIAPYCTPDSATVVRIASFGPIGPDLQGAKKGNKDAADRVARTISDRLREKLQVDSERTARQIISHITLTKVGEAELTSSVLDKLRHALTSVDSESAFTYLMWWIVSSSETRLRIDRATAIQKVSQIGEFLAQRAAYHDEWYTSIVPIRAEEYEDAGKLKREFYRGGRVRFTHIDANLDVARPRWLNDIHDALRTCAVVVVHGASGQGKTTLAYRYVKECAPDEFRFEVRQPEGIRHARRLALALTGHARAIVVPTLIYVDVRPGDTYWVELVREISAVNGIKVLVTVREEDWKRTPITASDFEFSEVIPSFDKEEAEAIYKRLFTAAPTKSHLDFEDAWNQFGNRKTLFEFVYYLTQEDSLRSRIAAQITALQEDVRCGLRSRDEIELLRLVSIAGAFEARVELRSMVAALSLSDPVRSIELLEDEYLIRVSSDRQLLECFHSLRSRIIADKLTDAAIDPWAEAACRCLPHVVEADLEVFLLCHFSRKQSVTTLLLEALREFQPRSWIGVKGIATALMWNGIREYAEQNGDLLREVFESYADAWYMILDWDLGYAFGEGGFHVFDALGSTPQFEQVAARATEFRKRQTDKSAVFDCLRDWLQQNDQPPALPTDRLEFSAFAETMFWVGHLNVDSPLAAFDASEVLAGGQDQLSIHDFGHLAAGVHSSQPEQYECWLADEQVRMLNQLRVELRIVALTLDDGEVVAHYLLPFDALAAESDRHNTSATSSSAHGHTIEHVRVLHGILPGKKKYGAVAYGHRSSLVPLEFDDGDKPGILATSLHPHWIPRLNKLALGFVDIRFRPQDWTEYFDRLINIRKSLGYVLDDLLQTIHLCFRTS